MPISVLALTNAYPTEDDPVSGAFIKAQIQSLRQVGVDVDVFHADRRRAGRFVYRRLVGELESRLATKRYELMHVMYGGVMAERATRVRSLPVVVSFCGSDLNGVPAGPLTVRLSAAVGVRASYHAARRANEIIVKSRRLAGRLPHDIDATRVHVIPNGVDLDRFRAHDREECVRKLGWSPEKRYLLFYGREAGKRPELAQAALDLARSTLGPVDIEIKTLSGVSHDEVPIWLNACWCLLCTSISEGSPNVVKEALACDIPVVSTEVGDVKERVGAVEGCYVVAPEPNAIARAIAEVIKGPGRVLGHETMRDLSAEATANRLLDLYRSVGRVAS